jgi:transposase
MKTEKLKKYRRTVAQKIEEVHAVDTLRARGVPSGEAQKRVGISSASYSTWSRQIENGQLKLEPIIMSKPKPEPEQTDIFAELDKLAPKKDDSAITNTIERIKDNIDILAELCTEINLAEVSTADLLAELGRPGRLK